MNNVTTIRPVGMFGQLASELAMTESKSGSTSAVLLTKKQYGEANGLKGAALNQAHYEYKRAAMSDNAKVVGAALLTGEIGLTRVSANARRDGGSLSFKLMDSLSAPKAPELDLSKATEDDVGTLVDRLRELCPGVKVDFTPVKA